MLTRIITSLRTRTSRFWCPEDKRKIIHTSINDYELLVLANEDVGRQIHYLNRYEQAETEYLRTAIRSSDVCIDIGANVGYFTMLMARAAPTGTVHAFEPLTLNACLLRAGAEINGFANVRVNQCAVGNVVGEVSFSKSFDSAYSSMIDTDRKPLDRVLRIPSTTLDTYVEQEHISRVDVLKVDVEGAEELVLIGASHLLGDEDRRPRAILIELYDDNLKAFGSSVASIVKRLRDLGYFPYVIDGHGPPIPFTEELKSLYYNVLFLLP